MRKGVMRTGHVQIRVLDLPEAEAHYRDRLGLIETHREADRVFYKGWTECDKYSVIIREADSAGMDFMGFKVDSDARLDELRQDLVDHGLEVDRVPGFGPPNGNGNGPIRTLERRVVTGLRIDDLHLQPR